MDNRTKEVAEQLRSELARRIYLILDLVNGDPQQPASEHDREVDALGAQSANLCHALASYLETGSMNRANCDDFKTEECLTGMLLRTAENGGDLAREELVRWLREARSNEGSESTAGTEEEAEATDEPEAVEDADAKSISVTLYCATPPCWKSAEDALEYLEGEFAERCMALNDLLDIGITPPDMFAHDLAELAETLAAFLRDPSRPLAVDDQTLDYSAVEALAGAAVALGKVTAGGPGVKAKDGCHLEVSRESLSILTRDLAHASRGLGKYGEWKYDEEMKDRAEAWELHARKARADLQLKELELRHED